MEVKRSKTCVERGEILLKAVSVVFFSLFVAIFSLSFFMPGISLAATCSTESSSLFQEAKRLFFENRDDKNLRIVASKLEKAVELCPENHEAWKLMGFVYWDIGDRLPRDQKKLKISWYEKGEAASDKVLEVDPHSPDGLFWKTTNMAGKADMKGWMQSLWIFSTMMKNMEQVDELQKKINNRHFFYGATDRFFCELITRIPLFLVGQFGLSVDQFTARIEKEISLQPGFFPNYTYGARLYWKIDNKKRALDLLDFVLKNDPYIFPEERAYNQNQKNVARTMWKEFTKKEYPNR